MTKTDVFLAVGLIFLSVSLRGCGVPSLPLRVKAVNSIYLPMVGIKPAPTLLMGLYEIGGGVTVAEYDDLHQAHHSIIGDFVVLDELNTQRIEQRWQVGYLDFINLMPTMTIERIVNGELDDKVNHAAESYHDWQSLGEGRVALLTPMPEMNGNWTLYGGNPEQFKLAWERLRNIFAEHGARALWVFAPNGWSSPPYHIEDYYPGDELVDLVGLSGFNFGECYPTTHWESPQETFGPYLDEVRAFTNKPLIISQYGSSTLGGNRELWLAQAFEYFKSRQIQAALYFNIDKECDWAINSSVMYQDNLSKQKYSPPPKAIETWTLP